MTKSKKAILWGQDDLLAHSIEIFLTTGETWEVIRIPIGLGDDDLLDQAKAIRPDVIILYEGNCAMAKSLPMQLIQAQPDLKVVTVSLEDNRMQVFSKHSVTVRRVSDLLAIIEDRYFSESSA